MLAIPTIMTASEEMNGLIRQQSSARIPWVRIAWVVGIIVVAAFFLVPRVEIEPVITTLRTAGPWVFYLAFALFTLVGLPSTPFFIIGGATFALWENLIGSSLGMLLHFLLAFQISSKWMRRTISTWLEVHGMTAPGVEPDNEWKVALMIKFAPGPPMFVKSYLMGVTGMSFKPFIIVSMPATWTYAVAWLTLGKSAMEGSVGWFLGGMALLIFSTAVWRFIKACAEASSTSS